MIIPRKKTACKGRGPQGRGHLWYPIEKELQVWPHSMVVGYICGRCAEKRKRLPLGWA